MHVDISGKKVFGDWFYFISLNGERYDFFMMKRKLTSDEMITVRDGYRDALSTYHIERAT